MGSGSTTSVYTISTTETTTTEQTTLKQKGKDNSVGHADLGRQIAQLKKQMEHFDSKYDTLSTLFVQAEKKQFKLLEDNTLKQKTISEETSELKQKIQNFDQILEKLEVTLQEIGF